MSNAMFLTKTRPRFGIYKIISWELEMSEDALLQDCPVSDGFGAAVPNGT
jgi:hypothetical protein